MTRLLPEKLAASVIVVKFEKKDFKKSGKKTLYYTNHFMSALFAKNIQVWTKSTES